MPEFDNNVQGLILVVGGLVVFLNQGLALARKYLEEHLDKRKGNGTTGAVNRVEAAVVALRQELQKRPFSACNMAVEDTRRVENIERLVVGMDARLASWQTAVDRGEFGCHVRGSHLRTIERLEDRMAKGDSL